MEYKIYFALVLCSAIALGVGLFFLLKRMGLKGRGSVIAAIVVAILAHGALVAFPGRVYVVEEENHAYTVEQYRIWGSYTVQTDSIASESVAVPVRTVVLVNKTDDYAYVSPLLYGNDDFLEEDSLVYVSPQQYVLVPKATKIDFYPDEEPPSEIKTKKSSEYKYHLQIFDLEAETGVHSDH